MAERVDRISKYGIISTELSLLSDQKLLKFLSKATPIGTSIGGTSGVLEICGSPVFVKKVRLTDIERRPEKVMSTANLFELPSYYQYGIGSTGFGAWRELATHGMTTNWVVTGECLNFPLMYHWRVLPELALKPPTSAEIKEMDTSVEFWEGSSAVRTRLESNQGATASLVLFLEFFPQTLHQWFSDEIIKSDDSTVSACKMVESNLESVTTFMNSRGLLHFDAHFKNILTDGNRLYFSDFGLATCSRFELSKTEVNFFNKHRDYDRFYTVTHLVNWLITTLVGVDSRDSTLQEYVSGKVVGILSPPVELIVRRYARIAIVMNKFHKKLMTDTKNTEFPLSELQKTGQKLNGKPG